MLEPNDKPLSENNQTVTKFPQKVLPHYYTDRHKGAKKWLGARSRECRLAG